MKPILQHQPKDVTSKFNKIAYGAFVLLAGYYFFVHQDLSNVCINFGIALVFDPFNQKVAWDKRPLYQRIWLIAHLLILLVVFIFMITGH